MTLLTLPRSVGIGLSVLLLALNQCQAEKLLFFLMPLPVPCSPHLVMLKVIGEMADRGHDIKVRYDKETSHLRRFLSQKRTNSKSFENIIECAYVP